MSSVQPNLRLVVSELPATPAAHGVSAENPADDWIAWQLADSAFPTGGFAHSGGLEAAWQHREVRDAGELEHFIKAALLQTARSVLPILLDVHGRPDRFSECDDFCGAFITNHVANRASRLQGRALLASARNAFGNRWGEIAPGPEGGHLAPVFGVVTRRLDIPRGRAARLFFFWHLRGWLGSAVRLGMIGPGESQSLQFKLRIFVEETAQSAESAPVSIPHQTAPVLEIWQTAQDRMYSRLFQS